MDDSLGNAFDFDYDYFSASFDSRSTDTRYGYANDGGLTGTVDTEAVHVRRSFLAVLADAGRDASCDLLLERNGSPASSVSFHIPSTDAEVESLFDFSECDHDEKVEKSRHAYGLLSFDASRGIRIYSDGARLCTLYGDHDSTVSGVRIGGVDGYTVSYDDATRTVGVSHSSESAVLSVTEVMIAYEETHSIAHATTGGVNPYCIGIRVPCYEKVKSSTLFVSSFPNWLKGHVNNDLDVFYGNQLYSGVEVKGSTTTDYHGIYPSYVKDGWYAMYSEGAIEFNEQKTEYDYFDVVNFSSISADSTEGWNFFSGSNPASELLPDYWAAANKVSLEYYKVRYNVAHLDGIRTVSRGLLTNYSNKNGIGRYSLLEDDDYVTQEDDYQIVRDRLNSADKRWVLRQDETVRRIVEAGQEEVPKIIENDSKRTTDVLYDLDIADGEIALVNTENDRISAFSIRAGSHAVFSFESNPTAQRKLAVTGDSARYVRVHAKVFDSVTIDGEEQPCIAFGLESDPSVVDASVSRGNVFSFSDDDIDWVYFPDTEDTLYGEIADGGDSYYCQGVDSVQSNELTIDGMTMKAWHTADEPDAGDKIDISSTGYAPLSGEVRARRYRYHNAGAEWGYDVYFEVLSYRYNSTMLNPYTGHGSTPLNCVEVVAYRMLTK